MLVLIIKLIQVETGVDSVDRWRQVYLMKVTWSSYIQGCSSRLGYFPNGGTMRLKTRAMQTKTAGRMI